VSFPLFAKIDVKGPKIHPLYAHLTTNKSTQGDIKWNFDKFLINKKGEIIARFDPKTKPGSKELLAKIEAALKE
jgi:glutathione peroxidase